MTIALTVPVPLGVAPEAFLDDVAAGVRRLLGDLGLPDELETRAGDEVTVSGVPIATTLGAPTVAWADAAQQVVAELVLQRTVFVTAVLADQEIDAVERLGRFYLAELGVRYDGAPWDGEQLGEEELARRLAPTDPQPLRVTLTPADAKRLFRGDLASIDLMVRQSLYDNSVLALPPVIDVDESATVRATTAWVRDVRFPSCPLEGGVEEALQRAIDYWTQVAVANGHALVTPAALDVAMVLASSEFPCSSWLAEQRWTPAALADLLRFRLRTFDSGPADLPEAVEMFSMLEIPEADPDDVLAVTLVREFPGIAAGYLSGWFDERAGDGQARAAPTSST